MPETAEELFEHGLRDMYDAEQKLVKALAKMAKDVEDEKLARGFEQHRDQTEGHVERLDQVFEIIDTRPRREPCAGIDGLIKEYTKFIREEKPEGPILNVFAAGAAKKVEHYEIASYQELIELANQIDLPGAARLLQQNLREEELTLQKLETASRQLGRQLAEVMAEQED